MKQQKTTEIKEGYKKSKLDCIPDEWELIAFNEVFDFIKSYAYSRNALKSFESKDDVLNIHYGDIHSTYGTNNLNVGDSTDIIPTIVDPKDSYDYLKDGDLVIADASEDYEGICACIELRNVEGVKVTGGLHTYTARDSSGKTTKGYRTYVLKNQNVDKELKRVATGISVYGVSKSNLGKVLIPLPPLPEQKKIADILSTWDKAIETTQALIDKLQLRKKGLMQQLLTGKKRLPGFSGEWEEIVFGDILKERKEFPNTELPLYSLTILDGVTPKTERYERSFLLASTENAYKKMVKNDFALNPMNLRFGAIAKHSSDIEVCVSKYYNIFYCLEKCNSTFFEYYLKSYPMIQYYNRMATGSLEEKKRVHFKEFMKFKKLLPAFEEQTAISKVLTKADEEIDQTQYYLEQLQEQKKGLMQQLLTGQKRVKV